jgi:hypothetical protein
MGRSDSISFADLRRKVAHSRHRRETVPCGLCGKLPTPEGHDASLALRRAPNSPAAATARGLDTSCSRAGRPSGAISTMRHGNGSAMASIIWKGPLLYLGGYQ